MRRSVGCHIGHLVDADLQASKTVGRGLVKFLVIEPFTGNRSPLSEIEPYLLDWIIVGGLTGPRPAQPGHYALLEIIRQCHAADCAVLVKDSVGSALADCERPREFPQNVGINRAAGGARASAAERSEP